jgi:hypothetical protein
VTLLDGARSNSQWTVSYALGCNITGNDTSGFSDAITVARNSDVILLTLGDEYSILEAEALDRLTLELPVIQQKLLAAVREVKNAKLIGVLYSGGALTFDATQFDAVLYAFFPGMYGGQAIVDIVTGATVPSGRLPYTIYGPNYLNQIPPSRNMSWGLEVGGVGISYRYLKPAADVLFPFGFGLSFSRFSFQISNTTLFSVTVTNLGPYAAAAETILLIASPGSGRQRKQLYAFDRTPALGVGQSAVLNFTQNPPETATANAVVLVVGRNGQTIVFP